MDIKGYRGQLNTQGRSYAIVAGRFNGLIVDALVKGALEAFEQCGKKASDVDIFWAPGGFEIPQVLKKVVAVKKVDGVICLGAVIRGATPHFEYVANAATHGIAGISLESAIPVTNGVLTCDTIEQAIERSGTKAGNKGYDAAMALIETVDLLSSIEKGRL